MLDFTQARWSRQLFVSPWQHYKRPTSLIHDFGPGSLHPVLSLHPHHRPPCRCRSNDRLVHRAPPPPSTLLDLLPRHRQTSLPQHRQILSTCVQGAALEAVLFRVCSTYLSQQENRSPLLYSDFLSWLRIAFVQFAPSDPPWHAQHHTRNAYGFPLLYSTLVKSQ